MRHRYTATFRDSHGNYIASGTVAVYLAGTSSAANIYTDVDSATHVHSVTTSSTGRYTFFVDRFDYDSDQTFKIVCSKTGYTSLTVDNITIEDACVQTYTIADDKTVTTNVFAPVGCIYSVASGKTLTFSGKFDGSISQHFAGAGSVVLPKGTRAYAEWFGAVGDDSTDCATAISSALSSLTTSGGTLTFAGGTYQTTDGFYIRGNVNIEGNGSSLKQMGASFATVTVLLYYQSPTAATRTSSGALAGGGTQLTLNAVTGLAVGDEVFLQLGAATYDATQPFTCMFNRITDITGLVVTFAIPFPEDVASAAHNCIDLTRIVENVRVSDLTLEAASDAEPDQAMYIERCRNVTVENIIMNHTGSIINAQSQNVSLNNIYSKRARKYSYAASGNVIGGWGFKNYLMRNIFCHDCDKTGIYLEAEGRGATIENLYFDVGETHTTSGYGLWVGGNCKGITLKNGHFNANYSNFYGPHISENAEVRTEDVFLYNGTLAEGFMKYHSGLLGWDADTGVMVYYDKIKQYTIKVTMANDHNVTYTIPSGIYKQVRGYISDSTKITSLQFKYGGSLGDNPFASLVTATMVDLSSNALTSLGPDASYPFNNNTGHTLTVTGSASAVGTILIINIEYYSIDNDAALGMIQDTYT
jgi:hypothetical protein